MSHFSFVDDGHLTAQGFKAGFKGNELSHYLDQHQIRARGLVTAGNTRIIVQDQAGSLLLYGEGQQELKALECSGSKDGLEINCATEKILIAVNGTLICLFFFFFSLPYFFAYKTVFFPSKTIPKNLDPSYQTDLDLWDCLGRVKPVLQQNCKGLI